MTLHIETPLVRSDILSDLVNKDIRLKLDALQPSGSFKIRGIGYACEHHAGRGAKAFLSSSGGNAGMAVAYAGKKLGIPVKVVVPETTTPRSIGLLEEDNAEVIIHGTSWLEANILAQSIMTDETAFIHPFDDELLWLGHSSMIDEIHTTEFKPDLIILSVGGGGLLAGVIQGLMKNNWEDIPIMTVETAGAASLNRSLKNGKIKFIGNAESRIREDYLRVLRYIRFFLDYSNQPHDLDIQKKILKNISGINLSLIHI